MLYWIFATVLALFSSPVSALIFGIAYLIYIQIEAYVITPRVMSKAISIPGSLVVIGALIGGTLLGLLGALIAVPVTASILLIIKQVFIPRQNASSETRRRRIAPSSEDRAHPPTAHSPTFGCRGTQGLAGRRQVGDGASARWRTRPGTPVRVSSVSETTSSDRWPATSRVSRTTMWWRGQSTPESAEPDRLDPLAGAAYAQRRDRVAAPKSGIEVLAVARAGEFGRGVVGAAHAGRGDSAEQPPPAVHAGPEREDLARELRHDVQVTARMQHHVPRPRADRQRHLVVRSKPVGAGSPDPHQIEAEIRRRDPPVGEEDRRVRARDALERGVLGSFAQEHRLEPGCGVFDLVVPRHVRGELVSHRGPQRTGCSGQLLLHRRVTIGGGVECGAGERIHGSGEGIGCRRAERRRGRAAGGIQCHAHDPAIAPAAGDQ